MSGCFDVENSEIYDSISLNNNCSDVEKLTAVSCKTSDYPKPLLTIPVGDDFKQENVDNVLYTHILREKDSTSTNKLSDRCELIKRTYSSETDSGFSSPCRLSLESLNNPVLESNQKGNIEAEKQKVIELCMKIYNYQEVVSPLLQEFGQCSLDNSLIADFLDFMKTVAKAHDVLKEMGQWFSHLAGNNEEEMKKSCKDKFLKKHNISRGSEITCNSNCHDDYGKTKKRKFNEETKVVGVYVVDKIKDCIRKNGKELYRVSWEGYSSEDDTWEPVEHLKECKEELLLFCRNRIESRHIASQNDPQMLSKLCLPQSPKILSYLQKAFIDYHYHPTEEDLNEAFHDMQFGKSSKGPMNLVDINKMISSVLQLKIQNSKRYKDSVDSIKKALTHHDAISKRKIQKQNLKEWEEKINSISSNTVPLVVENNVDFSGPPENFVYINEYLPGEGIIIPSDPVIGCKCLECSPSDNCCAKQMNSHFAYNKQRRLRINYGVPIYECNSLCKCSQSCINRVVQHGRKVKLSIFRTSNGRGWGVKALQFIKCDTFVIEYVGEVISSEEAEKRGKIYDSRGCTYLFDLDFNNKDAPYTVDAAKYGNCEPNLAVYNVWVDGLDPDLPKLALFSCRDIAKGEELTFDYNASYYSSSAEDKESRNSAGRSSESGTTSCKCSSESCRGFFF